MSLREWVVHVENAVYHMEDMSKESELNKKRCIYRVPDYIRELDNRAFEPQVVSFGPYHHGGKNLEPMERNKNRALLQFLKRSNKPLQEYLDALAQEVDDLRDAYDQPLPERLERDEVFLKMLIHDGCFIIEILRTMDRYDGHGYLTETPLIVRDMLLLENQVPLRLLAILVAVERNAMVEERWVKRSILKFFSLHIRESMSNGGSYKSANDGLHILDMYRRELVVGNIQKSVRKRAFGFSLPSATDMDIPSATDLQEAGIRFKTSKTTKLKDITFKDNTLRLPEIMVTEDTKSFFLNLMAFERVHMGTAGCEVNSYVYFMGCLIKTDRDASLLRSLGFVPNALGSGEDVAQLFRLISKKTMLHPDQGWLVEVIVSVNKKLRNRVRKRLSAWRMDLVQNYLKSPWGVVSVIGAIILFTLTIIQTVYAVLSYIHRKDK